MGHLRRRIEASYPSDVEIRHDLHRHPELGYEEKRTSGVVQNHLKELGLEFCGNLAGGTGVLAFLPATHNADSARTVALRADMDALPISEETELEYCSTAAGKMHACGHDGHTTMLMATARALKQAEDRPNNVLFLFQPAEEGGAGGRRMCQEGALAGRIVGPAADVIYGMHGNPQLELGHVSSRVGPIMASATEFKIRIAGKGTHAAMPHLGIDPIVVASHIVMALQTVASRNVNPLESIVITVGKIEAGSAHNVIPDDALLWGTFRTLSDELYELAKRRIDTISKNVAAAFGAAAEVEFVGSYPVTVNHEGPTQNFLRVAGKTLSKDVVHVEPHPMMGAEDFSFYGQEIPACFFFLGLRAPEQASYPDWHSPRFDFNDRAIPIGVELFCELALDKMEIAA